MAFCSQCGGQLTPGAAACAACGMTTGMAQAAAPAPARYVSPVNAQEAAGFVSSLFDFSFNNFITTKIIKVLYVISIVLAGLGALAVVGAGFSAGALAGIFSLLIVAPLLFIFYVIYARVIMEVLIVIFRSSEYLAEIAKQGRR